MYSLLVAEGPDAGARFPLPEREPQLIGRSTEAIPIRDDSVSRRHAELTPDQGRWWIRDLESSNGTYVNDTPVLDRVPIGPGDRIRCGDTILVLVHSEETATGGGIRAADPALTEVIILPEEASSSDAEHRLLPLLELATESDPVAMVTGLCSVTGDLMGADATALVRLNDQGGVIGSPIIRNTDGRNSETPLELPRQLIQAALASERPRIAQVDGGPSIIAIAIRDSDLPPAILVASRPQSTPWQSEDLDLLALIGNIGGLLLLAADRMTHASRTERLAAMGEAIAALSHSIKNILQGLRGGADAVELALNRDNTELARQGWTILARNLDRILALSLNMLVYSKDRDLDLEPRQAGSVARDAVELLAASANRREIDLECRPDPAEPPIPIDPDALHQVILNLVGNALDAVDDRSGRVLVTTRFDPDRNEVTIEVLDNGPGISADRRERIFEPFFSTKGQRGTGLGLAVARKLVEQHLGTITLLEGNHAGATFRITLPASRSDELDAAGTRGPRALPDGDLGVTFS
ncbi:MAG: ATP-binding protein [Phycisphaerales bacterium]|nr:ATP-binding protein [Phycisphaerales bacterium]